MLHHTFTRVAREQDWELFRLLHCDPFGRDANTKKGDMRVSRIEVPLGTRGITTITNG